MKEMRTSRGLWLGLWVVAFALLAMPEQADAYVGPGAGIAFVSSFLVLFTTIILSVLSILLWPFRKALRVLRGVKIPKASFPPGSGSL